MRRLLVLVCMGHAALYPSCGESSSTSGSGGSKLDAGSSGGTVSSGGAAGGGAGGAAGSGTGGTAGSGGTPAPSAAQLWVDPDGGSCVRQPTPGPWVDAEACTWNEAYQAAHTGDQILVKGGDYGDVAIGPDSASLSPPGVTFWTVSGENVVVRDFENGFINGDDGGNDVRFVGPIKARTFRSDQTENVVVDGWTVDCGGCDNVQTFHVEGSNNVTVQGSDIGNNQNNSLIYVSGSNLTFENNLIHDAGLPSGSPAHTECMYATSVQNLTLKRNHFYHCAVMDVFITGNDVADGGFIENNVFEKPWSTTGVISDSALAFHFRNGGDPPTPDPSNWDFRYNTFVGPLSITTDENPVGAGGMRVIGNAFLASAPCGHSNATYAFNAFVSGACGTDTVEADLSTYLSGFSSTGDPGNYGLKSISVLVNQGDPDDYPPVDRAGHGRFTGLAPDIGAYELGEPK